MTVLPLLAFAAALAGQAPNPQQAADCGARASSADQLVCADAELAALDGRVRDAWPPSPTAYIETAPAWFARSRQCAPGEGERTCLMQAYNDRLAVIEAALWGPPAVAAGLKCDGAWRGKALTGAPPEANRMLVIRESDAILAIASPAAGGPWKPALQWTRTKDGVTFRPLTGRAISCRLQTF